MPSRFRADRGSDRLCHRPRCQPCFCSRGNAAASLRRAARLASWVLGLGALLVLCAAPTLAVRLEKVRLGVHKGYTRVVLQTDAPVRHQVERSAREITVHLDAQAQAQALTAKSPQLIWVKVSPSAAGGSDVRIQLRGASELKSMVLRKPDRLVLDVYPAKSAAATPPPTEPPRTAREAPAAKEAAPPPPPAPVPAPGEAAPAPPPAPPPPGTAQAPSPAGAAEPLPGPSLRPSPAASPPPEEEQRLTVEVLPPHPPAGPAASAPPPAPPPRSARPGTQPVHRSPLGFLPAPFDEPIALGAAAGLLVVLFVALRLRRRSAAAPVEPLAPSAEEVPGPGAEPEEVKAVEGTVEEGGGEAPAETIPEASIFEPGAPEPSRSGEEEARASAATPVQVPPAGTAASDAPAGPELERRMAHLERRLEEVVDAKERLERQVAAQTEELRVQRAAIARTQRVLRSIARPEDDGPESGPKA